MPVRECRPSRLAALAAAAVFPIAAVADTSYHIGNSLTWDMYNGGLPEIAAGFGVALTPGYHIRNSASLVFIHDHPDDVSFYSPASWPAALPAQAWNFVTFEPFPDFNTPSTLQTDITAAESFIGLVPRSSAAAPVFFIYEAWPEQAAFLPDYDAYWNQAVVDDPGQRTLFARQYFDALHRRLTALQGDRASIRVIPVGDVLARIDRMIRAGQFQGASSITDFYRDGLHMGQAGQFAAAITTFATLYQRNPAGASRAALARYPPAGAVTVTPEVAAQLEAIAWDVVTSDSARTGVYPLALAVTSLAFRSTPVGEQDAPQAFAVSNVTARAIAIDAITTSDDFPQTSTCGQALAPNSGCAVTVTFAPRAAGVRTGTLTLRSGDTPYTVQLSGSASWPPVDLALSATPGSVAAGQTTLLAWSSSGATDCSASGGWSGARQTAGSESVSVNAASVTFTLSCRSSASGLSKDASVTVARMASPVPEPGGGGGAADLITLLAAAFLGLRRILRHERADLPTAA